MKLFVVLCMLCNVLYKFPDVTRYILAALIVVLLWSKRRSIIVALSDMKV